MPTSPNLLIDHIVQSQYQKEVTANTAFNALETAITSEASVAIGGTGDYTLSLTEMRHAVLQLTGTLTGNRNLLVPNRDKLYIVHNATTGAFTVTVKTSAGTGIVVEQGFKSLVYCDGTNVLEFTGPPTQPARTVTGSVTIRITDRIIYCDATGGNVIATLPSAATSIGRTFLFIRIDSSANTCTIQRAGGDDINNAATSKTITNTIGTGLQVVGYSSSRFLAQTLTAA